MHDPIVLVGALLLLAIVAAGLTLCVVKTLFRRDGNVDDDEARQQAEELRSRAEAMNRSSSQIQARAKRLEELLALQRREKDK